MWQPIETAPKDGTEILICTDDGKFYVVSYDDIFSAPWRIRNDEGLNEHVPAHWMSLPEAPNAAFSGGEAVPFESTVMHRSNDDA